MNAGVSTRPCGVVITPRRARQSVCVTVNAKDIMLSLVGALQDVKKLRVGVIYGGRSGEHEVSIASAAAVFKNIDSSRYEAVPIRIEKDGRWALPSQPPMLTSAADVIQSGNTSDEALA